MAIKNKKAMNFTAYFVYMFLVVSLIVVLGGMTAVLTQNYDTNTSEELEDYIDTFDADVYADQDKFELEKSGSTESGEFSEYEASFTFGDQVKQTANQTDAFVGATTEILGLPSYVWYIISGVIFIGLLIAIIYFVRGLSQ